MFFFFWVCNYSPRDLLLFENAGARPGPSWSYSRFGPWLRSYEYVCTYLGMYGSSLRGCAGALGCLLPLIQGLPEGPFGVSV